MINEIVKFEFNGQAVDFEPSKTNGFGLNDSGGFRRDTLSI